MIGIVVTHYEDPAGLDRVLTALEPATGITVVVADDGSGTLPIPGERPFPVQVVTQEDRGFRAAAARNLGARALLRDSAVRDLLFLDGDTVPTLGYVARMVETLQRVGTQAPHRRALVVGRRRYADLDGLTPAEVAEFVASPDPTRVLPDTAWLDEGYAATTDLAEADDRSYRFVISSVLGTTRELFTALDGFDESFVGYGGEDWDIANRAWLAGADLRHVPEAVAWHDGPDAAGREAAALADGRDPGEMRQAKRAETLRLAAVVTEPGARDPGLLWEVPDIAVEFDDSSMDAAEALLTCADLVRSSDARVWLSRGSILQNGTWPASDPRVLTGPIPEGVRARARHLVRVDRPVRLTRPLAELCGSAPVRLPGLSIDRTRDLARGDAAVQTRTCDGIRRPDSAPSLEAEWGWKSPHDLPVLSHHDGDTSHPAPVDQEVR